MIPRNTAIPAICSKRFVTSKRGQRDILVTVVEGGTDDGQYALKIGKCVVHHLPPDLPQGTVIKVTFQYSADGRLSVNADVPDVECRARTEIERFSGLSKENLEQWKDRIDAGLQLAKLEPQEVDPQAGAGNEMPGSFAGLGSTAAEGHGLSGDSNIL